MEESRERKWKMVRREFYVIREEFPEEFEIKKKYEMVLLAVKLLYTLYLDYFYLWFSSNSDLCDLPVLCFYPTISTYFSVGFDLI